MERRTIVLKDQRTDEVYDTVHIKMPAEEDVVARSESRDIDENDVEYVIFESSQGKIYGEIQPTKDSKDGDTRVNVRSRLGSSLRATGKTHVQGTKLNASDPSAGAWAWANATSLR